MYRTAEDLVKIADISLRFRKVANSANNGYCKEWKSYGIVMSMSDIILVTLRVDAQRIKKYVHSCLEMEGFTSQDCDDLGAWLYVELRTLFNQDKLNVMGAANV